jgi:uncharacterized damage-inducible protein DinB
MEKPGHPVLTEIRALLNKGQAHATLADAVEDFPADLRGARPHGLPYSAWQLVEHLRIAQRDILDFSNNYNDSYKMLKWPDEYWPKEAAPPSADAWDKSLHAIRDDLYAFEELLQARDAELTVAFPWGKGQTLLREALLIADHNAYHVGELIVLRRLLGCWK